MQTLGGGLPDGRAGLTSIIVPVWNQHDMTRSCIEALRDSTDGYELIIVDNGSDPPVQKPYLGFTDCTVIRFEENLGFPVAVNEGIHHSKGDVIILLNNDVFVTPGWAERLVAHLKNYDIVSPVTNYVAGMQRVITPAYENQKELNDVAHDWAQEYGGASWPVNWIIGFCMAFPKKVYEDLGEFDESLWPSSGEEIDFCFRARAKGLQVGIARDVYVHHEGSRTFLDMEKKGLLRYNDVVEKSNAKIASRWGEGFWDRQNIGSEGVDGLRINVGCGVFKLDGFVNIDQEPEVKPDMVCDILDLPYEEESVDAIYAGHILEHFDWKGGEVALHYWYSLLKPGGKIWVVVPDFDVLAEKYIKNPSPEALREFNDMYIYSYAQKSPHKYAYSAELLKEVMVATGFRELKRMPVDHPYFPHAVVWQVGFEGVK